MMIVGNPVRGKLVAQARDYQFSGSFVWGEAVVEAFRLPSKRQHETDLSP